MVKFIQAMREHLSRAPQIYQLIRLGIAAIGFYYLYAFIFSHRFAYLIAGITFVIPFSLGVFSAWYYVRLALFAYWALFGTMQLWAYSYLTAHVGFAELREVSEASGTIAFYWYIPIIIFVKYAPPLTLVWSKRLAKLGR